MSIEFKAIHGDKGVLILNAFIENDECVKNQHSFVAVDGFKFNTHADKFFERAELTPKEKAMALDVASKLSKTGLYMVGLDVIDEKIIEINVTSPCYFIREINHLDQTNFQNTLMSQIINFINAKTAKLYAKTNS